MTTVAKARKKNASNVWTIQPSQNNEERKVEATHRHPDEVDECSSDNVASVLPLVLRCHKILYWTSCTSETALTHASLVEGYVGGGILPEPQLNSYITLSLSHLHRRKQSVAAICLSSTLKVCYRHCGQCTRAGDLRA